MEKGFNSDIIVSGMNYHVQTEDWGDLNPYVVSRIFYNGAVVRSIKTPYNNILCRGPATKREAIRFAMRDQHQKILDQLVSGQLVF